jgi:ribonuclease BN (tRNA processing enzyme)
MLNRHAAGYLLEPGSGLRFLVDCGSATLLQLEAVGKRYHTLDALFITHTHADHIGDLIPLLHACHGLEHDPNNRRTKPLPIFGPPGFRAFFDQVVLPVTGMPRGFDLSVHEVLPVQDVCGVTVTTARTVHSSRFASVAYGFACNGCKVVLSGDCDWQRDDIADRHVLQLAQGADLLVLDCSTIDEEKVDGHLSAGLCGKIAEQAAARALLLSHLYPVARVTDDPEALRMAQARRHYTGALYLAHDLMTLEIQGDSAS